MVGNCLHCTVVRYMYTAIPQPPAASSPFISRTRYRPFSSLAGPRGPKSSVSYRLVVLDVASETHVCLVGNVTHDGGDDRHVHDGDAGVLGGPAEVLHAVLLHRYILQVSNSVRSGDFRSEVAHPAASGRPDPA